MLHDEDDDIIAQPQKPVWIGMPIEFTGEIAKYLIKSASPLAKETTASIMLKQLQEGRKSPEVIHAFLAVVCDKLKIPKAVQDELMASLSESIGPWVAKLLESKSARQAGMDLFRELLSAHLQTAVPKMIDEVGLDEVGLREAALKYQQDFIAHYIVTNPAYRQKLDSMAARVVNEAMPQIEETIRQAAVARAGELSTVRINGMDRLGKLQNLSEPVPS